MTRRRRPPREIAFSMESFLDIVANVVGIIIRLILVAWIGARSYKAVVALPPPPPPPPAMADPEPPPDPSDPRLEQLARRREELSHEEQAALALRQHEEEEIQAEAKRLLREQQDLAHKREELEQAKDELKAEAGETAAKAKGILLTVEELQKRSEKLTAQLKQARAVPKKTRALRYHSPVSALVQEEEVMFECNNGRVTLYDHGALQRKASLAVQRQAAQLRERGELSGETEPIGSFRLRFTAHRSGGPLDTSGTGTFQIGISTQAVPIETVRGESADQALSPGSAFRKIVDELDSKQTVVTLWVYPDSFALYRKLRDYLHGREVVVAGRPLPEGALIGSSPDGTVSRGQ